MRIGIRGLGSIGTAMSACLLKDGHSIAGYDISADVRHSLSASGVALREPGVSELLSAGRSAGKFSVASDILQFADVDIVMVCVGTAALSDGSLDLSDVASAARSVGEAVRSRASGAPPLLVVFRSTMPPGTMAGTVLPAVAIGAGEEPGDRYEVLYNPEFLREGTAMADYYSPGRIVVAATTAGAAEALLEIYSSIAAPRFVVPFESAELIKLADNSFHALKIAFANEVGRLAIAAQIDRTTLFDMFSADTKLNISSAYLRPGGPFGGPCLPKDVMALSAEIRRHGGAAPVVDSILRSNSLHAEFVFAEIVKRTHAGDRILLIGLSFKVGTDDLRGSPAVLLAEQLLDAGYDVRIYDADLEHGSRDLVPPSLRDRFVERSSVASSWDLAVFTKTDAQAAGSLAPEVPVFSIDRL